MELNAILAISFRDLTKLLRDRTRIITSLLFPILFIGVFGGAGQAMQGSEGSFNYLTFTFVGVFAYTLFASATSGIISLVEDRQNDFTQVLFVSPISRYTIIFGKIMGESLVALPQGLAIVIFALIIGVSLSGEQLFKLVPVAVSASFLGAAFGLVVLSGLNSQRSANQIIPFIIFPQIILAGAFMPLSVLPSYLDVLSRIMPMRYMVDLARGVFYAGHPAYALVVADAPLFNIVISALLFALFLFLGTWFFVRNEKNR
jgi:ABC-2 type transport system permease protein